MEGLHEWKRLACLRPTEIIDIRVRSLCTVSPYSIIYAKMDDFARFGNQTVKGWMLVDSTLKDLS